MSAQPVDRNSPAETVAGLLAAVAIFAELTGIVYRPLRLIPFGILATFVAIGIGGRNLRLAGLSLAVGAVSFVVGMSVAVLTNHPLW
ncbi:MAG: hypothetical protein QOE36_1359 [Gaiellaceae bacterium]|nr:hypothetical protein [Gaiellaceae bacterium]